MKPSKRKKLLADIKEAQDRFNVEVVSLRGVQYVLALAPTHRLRSKSLENAVAFLRKNGWTVTNNSLENGPTSYLVGE